MAKTRLIFYIMLGLVIALQACENQLQRRVIFQIDEITLDRDVLAQGEPVNITATFNIVGTTNERSPSVTWESDQGEFESVNQVTTIWTAPTNYLGNLKIKLTATFMGHTDIAERTIRVVRTPAADWGSLSGYIYSEIKTPLNNVSILTSTGEGDTTDGNGFFYIADVPQGSNGLEFSNIPFVWSTELSSRIDVTGGSHRHLGNILFYISTPVEINSYQLLPEHQAILSIEHENINLVNYHELYRADDINGSGSQVISIVEPEISELLIQEDTENAFYAFKSVPLHGQASAYSAWTHISFINVVDPDADGSYFTYNNFFNATLNWQGTGYESYYKGFQVVEDRDTGWAYISPLLGVTTRSYDINTMPGQTGDFYVLAISRNNLFNDNQPEGQKINLEVPALEPPQNFRGRVYADNTIRLLWEPLANNNLWYSGYLLEKKVIMDTSTIDWEELSRIPTTISGEFTDEEADSGNVYHYRISSVAYPSEPGSVFYSSKDSISLSTK